MDDLDKFEKALVTRMMRLGKPLAAAEDLVKRLSSEGRGEDGVIILEAITALQKETVDLAYMHRNAMQRVSERDAELNKLIDEMFTNLKGHAHLTEDTYNSMTGTLRIFAQKTQRLAASNAVKARLPRGSRFPQWMHEVASAEARKGKKASAKRAADVIADRAPHENFEGDLPDEGTVGRWIKREQAKFKREPH